MKHFIFIASLVLSIGLPIWAAESAPVGLGRIEAGSIIPRIAAGGGTWSTEFRIFSLDGSAHDVRLDFFNQDGLGVPLELDLTDDEGDPLGSFSSFSTSVQPDTALVVRAPATGPLKAGWAGMAVDGSAETRSPEGQEVGVTALITNGESFRAEIPGLPALQRQLRMIFDNTKGFNTCVALTSIGTNETQEVTMIARARDGTELCRASSSMEPLQHDPFCLADRLSCVPGNAGILDIMGDQGVAAIGLAADSNGRFWTQLPVEQGQQPIILASGLFALPENAASVDWMVVNNSPTSQTFTVTVFQSVGGPKTIVSPGSLGFTLDPGGVTHSANSVGTTFQRGSYYEVVLESTDRRVLPSVHVWQDSVNTVIPGTLIPAGSWAKIQ